MYARAALVCFKTGVALFLFLLLGCAHQPRPRTIDRSFYYWKSVFQLSPGERQLLDTLHVHRIYIKFFDVVWEPLEQKPKPIATINFKEDVPAGIGIVPVVFIANEVLLRIDSTAIPELAMHIAAEMAALHDKNIENEFQVDCDWSESTSAKYFQLLRLIRDEPYARNKKISATIRLHQLKYRGLTGVPPVDRGLLMCYNMGNLRHPEVKNSIIDVDEMNRYTDNLRTYPLPLDVAFPVFDWYVWFHENEYRGLMHTFQLPSLKKATIHFDRDTTIDDYPFEKGDWLRYEGSESAEVLRAAQSIGKRLKQEEVQVILYHLDEEVLRHYSILELDALYNGMR